MKDTRPVREQVAALSAKERKNILVLGIFVIAIALVVMLVFALVVAGELAEFKRLDRKANNMEITYVAGYIGGEEIKLLDKEKAAEQKALWKEADQVKEDLMTGMYIFAGAIVVVLLISGVIIKKTMPYYTEGRFYYLLLAAIKKEKFPEPQA